MLAIPHNGNLSNGLMFSDKTYAGKPLTRELAALRARMEPVAEVTQIKGDGEAHPYLSPNDEFANYETWDAANLDGTEIKSKDMLQYEYARSALRKGMQLEKKLKTNPFKFGMIGSTDAHTSLAAVEEENFFGKHSGVEPEVHRYKRGILLSYDEQRSIARRRRRTMLRATRENRFWRATAVIRYLINIERS